MMNLSQKRMLRSLEEKFAAGNLKPNDVDSTGLADIHRAAHEGYVTCLRWLTRHGGSTFARSAEGCVAAHYAAANGHVSILQFLLVETPDTLETKDYNGTVPVYIAAQENRIDCVIWFAKNAKSSLMQAADDGMTALHAAAQEGNIDCVRYLVQSANCTALAEDKAGCTPLHFASAEGHWRVIKWLIEHGGVLGTEQDKTGATPMHLAAECNRVKAIKVLRKLGVPTQIQDQHGRTPLDIATEHAHQECMNALSQKFNKGLRPFQGIYEKGSLKRVRFNETREGNRESIVPPENEDSLEWDESVDLEFDADDESNPLDETRHVSDPAHIRKSGSINQLIADRRYLNDSGSPVKHDHTVLQHQQRVSPSRSNGSANGRLPSQPVAGNRDQMLRPLLADIIQDLQSAHNARLNVTRRAATDTRKSELPMSIRERQQLQSAKGRRQMPVKPSWLSSDLQRIQVPVKYSTKGPHPQQQIKLSKDGIVSTVPAHRSNGAQRNGTAVASSNTAPLMKAPRYVHQDQGKEFQRYQRYYANGNGRGMDHNELLYKTPLTKMALNRHNNNNMEERVSYFSYNLAPRRSKGSVRWTTFVSGISSLFSSLKSKRKTKDPEESVWWTGTKGLYMPNTEHARDGFHTMPAMRSGPISEEDFEISPRGNKMKPVSIGRGSAKDIASLQPGVGVNDFTKVKSLALDRTLRGQRDSSQATPAGQEPSAEESLEDLLSKKGQTGFELKSLRVNQRGSSRERGNALIW